MERLQLKKLKVVLLLMVILCLAAISNSQTLHGARPQGLGGAFTALSNDPSALNWNPAGLELFSQNAIVSHYTSMYSGFCNDNIGNGAIGYVHHIPDIFSVGLSGDMFYSDIYTQNVVSLSAAKKTLPWLDIGLRANMYFNNYNESNFVYTSDDIQDDPLFDNYGYSNNAFGLDFGVIGHPMKEMNLGLYLKNLVNPNLAFTDDKSKDPMYVRTGIAYTIWNKLTLSADAEFLSKSVAERNFKYYMGAEMWQFEEKVGIRAGINSDQLAFGASYRNPKLAFLNIDYAFIYPLSKMGNENANSHKFSMAFGFKKEHVKKEPVIKIAAKIDTVKVIDNSVLPEPTASIKVSPAKLQIEEITQIYEEEPLVPLIFFDAKSDIVDPRFNVLLKTIGERLITNNDISVKLYGFFDNKSESNDYDLALRRAKAVKKRLELLVPSSSRNIEIVDSGYEKDMSMAGLGSDAPNKQQQEMINQENRRVKFEVIIGEQVNREMTIADNEEEIAQYYKEILKNNRDVDLIIKGTKSPGAISKAIQFKEKLIMHLPEDLHGRVFVSLSQANEMVISPNANGILYRPRELRSSLNYKNIYQKATIETKADVAGGFNEYRIDIVNDDMQLVKNIESGSGTPSKTAQWDWSDDTGNLIDIRDRYFAKIEGKDALGRDLKQISNDTIRVEVVNQEILKSKLLIVQFVYDKDVSQAVYLEDRLENIVRKLLEYSKIENKELNIEIEGHTDILGSDRRNKELAVERAKTEYEHILTYLKSILGFDNDEQLNNWFDEKNITISYKGYGSEKPYLVNYETDGNNQELMIGDNNLPEGRTINRRVLINMELIKY